MDSIDVKNRKPRRFKGTPAFRIRNYAIAAISVYTLVAGTLFLFSPACRNINTTIELLTEAKRADLEETTEEERLKKATIYHTYLELIDRKKAREQQEIYPTTTE